MKSAGNKSLVTKLVTVTLVASTVFVVCVTSVFAAGPMYSGKVTQAASTAYEFNTQNCTKYTLSMGATPSLGSPGQITIQVQKKILGGYFNVAKYYYSPINGETKTVINGYPVDKNTDYRILYWTDHDVAMVNSAYVLW